jgi:hypothetical protein
MFECFKCLPDKDCYLNLSDDMVDNNPLDMENIKEQQDADDALLQHATKYLDRCARSASAQLMISYATLSQEILQTIGKLHYQKAYCNQQLSGSTKQLVIQAERGYSCKSLVGITTEIFACLLTNFIANTVKKQSYVQYHLKNVLLT